MLDPLTLVLVTSLGVTASNCPDPKLRQAVIRSNTIHGAVTQHNTPFEIFLRSIASLIRRGGFATRSMPPALYRLANMGPHSQRQLLRSHAYHLLVNGGWQLLRNLD